MRCIEFDYQKKYIDDFIKLSHKLYDKKTNTQDDKNLRLLLEDKHILSKYFKLNKFCIYKDDEIVARFVITTYENDDTAYIGFFECIDDDNIAKFLFDKADKFVKMKGYLQIVGPVDASFWIKYRLKTNFYSKRPYTGEPYNKDYYLKLFIYNNYEIEQTYTSSIYKKVDMDFQNRKYLQRYEDFKNKDYKIISPDIKDWDSLISDIHRLITDLYKDFPVYKYISLEDFKNYFASYKNIINFDMVKMVYYKDEAVGFYISLPNYSNIVYDTNNIINLINIFKIRKNPKEYVMLYMGIDKNHKGLGKALVQSIMDELKISQLKSIGALQRSGNITQTYVNELIEDCYEYVLLKKKV